LNNISIFNEYRVIINFNQYKNQPRKWLQFGWPNTDVELSGLYFVAKINISLPWNNICVQPWSKKSTPRLEAWRGQKNKEWF